MVRGALEERFEGLQRFFAAVHLLTSEKRLSRMVARDHLNERKMNSPPRNGITAPC